MRPDTGVRAPALSLTTDCDMPPLTGNPRPSPERRLPAPIASSSWFASNRLPCFWPNIRPMADVSTAARTKPASAIGISSFRSCRLTAGKPREGRPCGTSPSNATPCASRSMNRAASMPPTHHEKRHRAVLEPELAGDERRQGDDADEQRHPVRVAQMRDEVGRALPEVAVRAFEPEQLRQLRARQIEGQAGFEPHQHGLGEEADRIAGADQPRRKRNRGDHQRHARREGRMAFRITGAEITHRRADQQRQRRRDGNDRLLRAAEDPEDEPRKQAGVQPRLGRESRQRGIADARGQQVRGQREAGHEIRPQPLGPILAHPPQRREGRRRHGVSWVQNVTATARTNVGFSSSGLKTYPVTSSCLNEKPASRPRWISRSVW